MYNMPHTQHIEQVYMYINSHVGSSWLKANDAFVLVLCIALLCTGCVYARLHAVVYASKLEFPVSLMLASASANNVSIVCIVYIVYIIYIVCIAFNVRIVHIVYIEYTISS